jgi:predicted transcriptional regulator
MKHKEKDAEHYKSTWTFLTNHSHVLLCLAKSNTMLMRDIAREVGITERAVQRIIADLRDEGFIKQHREGRCNEYKINLKKHLKHPSEKKRAIGDLIRMINREDG